MKAPVVRQIQQIVPEIKPDTLHPQEKVNLVLVEDNAPRMTEACHQLGEITTIDPAQCYLTGDGLTTATVGEHAEVTLYTQAQRGQRKVSIQTAPITAEMVCSQDNTIVKCNITKVEDSKCLIQYQPVTRGKHHLHITIGGGQPRGSPHTVVVRPRLGDLGKPVKQFTDLRHPQGVTVNSKGMIIVTETGANCVSVLTPDGRKLRSFGTGDEQFKWPHGVTVDGDDNIYALDNGNHCIQKFTSNGVHIASVGSQGDEELQFTNPLGIGFNRTNSKLYVCDQGNHRIQVLDTDLTLVKQFGSEGGGNGQFKFPWGVGFDGDGNVYIADKANHRIQVFTPEGQYLRQFGTEIYPTSIAIDKGRLFMTEYGNHRVYVLSTTGKFLHSFSSRGQRPGQIIWPQEIAIDDNGFTVVSTADDGCIKFY